MPTTAALLLVRADTVEISGAPPNEHARLAMYTLKERTNNGADRHARWHESVKGSYHSATTLYALLDLAERAGLTIHAWAAGERLP